MMLSTISGADPNPHIVPLLLARLCQKSMAFLMNIRRLLTNGRVRKIQAFGRETQHILQAGLCFHLWCTHNRGGFLRIPIPIQTTPVIVRSRIMMVVALGLVCQVRSIRTIQDFGAEHPGSESTRLHHDNNTCAFSFSVSFCDVFYDHGSRYNISSPAFD